MKILAIDTSSKNASVAITENEKKLIELNNADEKTHSQKLMPMIDETLTKTGLSLEDIGLIACCLGPGSFTGVRIGIATAKAFADSKNIPTVGVNSLEELAYNLNTEGHVCSLIDAGHGNTYAGFYKIEKDKNGKLQTAQEDLTFLNLKDEKGNISTKNLMEFLVKNIKEDIAFTKKQITEGITNNQNNLKKIVINFVGDATISYEEVFQNLRLSNKNSDKDIYEFKFSNYSQNIASGITVAQVGYTKYKNGQYGDSSMLSPIYLRKSQAELTLEEKMNTSK